MFEGRAAIGYEHRYDAPKLYLVLAQDLKYVEGLWRELLVEDREYDPERETCLRDLLEEGRRCSTRSTVGAKLSWGNLRFGGLTSRG